VVVGALSAKEGVALMRCFVRPPTQKSPVELDEGSALRMVCPSRSITQHSDSITLHHPSIAQSIAQHNLPLCRCELLTGMHGCLHLLAAPCCYQRMLSEWRTYLRHQDTNR
jgi:hypothetical protein